ncbi:MAG: GNAT family N-acetyltransferase [Hyphomicrobiaceae bacterium]
MNFLVGGNIALRGLEPDDASEAYLAWLNDQEVLRYRGPKAFPTTMSALVQWIESLPARGDLVLAIITNADGKHVGNIALNSIMWPHGSAELSILIGDKNAWGKGVGSEAITLLTMHAFKSMGLRRIWAESPNPAFNRIVENLGWHKEGIKRQALLVDGIHSDITCWSILREEANLSP